MSISNILLILVSGLGVVHGLFMAIFLWTYKKGNKVANRLLSLLLVVLSLRIGKSVFLEFLDELDVKIIFTGLATLTAIGPLFYLYSKSILQKEFSLNPNHLIHFLPLLPGIGFGLWVDELQLTVLPKYIFVSIFLFYYLHYLVYLFATGRLIRISKKEGFDKDGITLLKLLYLGLLIIWLAYFLNLFDDIIPYIFGPVLYSFVAYIVSFIIIKKDLIQKISNEKYKSNLISMQRINEIFNKVERLMEEDKLYRNPNLNMKLLADKLNVSTQNLSLVINKKSQINFNNFVNKYRIDEAVEILRSKNNHHLNISAIAYDVGFNSISSFNTSFKKNTGFTPKIFRQQVIK